jgi:hypothetical protein
VKIRKIKRQTDCWTDCNETYIYVYTHTFISPVGGVPDNIVMWVDVRYDGIQDFFRLLSSAVKFVIAHVTGVHKMKYAGVEILVGTSLKRTLWTYQVERVLWLASVLV